MESERTYTAFAGERLLSSGDLKSTLLAVKKHMDQSESAPVLVFEDQTGIQIDFDMSGEPGEVIDRLAAHPHFASREEQPQARTGPGRPKLGVVSREVSLLPRHWEWLEGQSGGASAALRRLVDEARKHGNGKQLARAAREAAGKFMWSMGGNLPDFEEASRALYAKDDVKLRALMADWPTDIRAHLQKLVAEAARLESLATTS